MNMKFEIGILFKISTYAPTVLSSKQNVYFHVKLVPLLNCAGAFARLVKEPNARKPTKPKSRQSETQSIVT